MPATVLDDLPASEPQFDYARLSSTLARTLQREHRSAFVLGLHGPWGAGKTTVLQGIRACLAGDAIVIDFNAWKYQEKEILWRALILRMIDALREAGGDAKSLEELERSLYEGFAVTERGELQVNWTSAVSVAVQAIIAVAGFGAGGGVVSGLAAGLRRIFGQKEGGDGKAEDTAKQVERVAGVLQRKMIQRNIRQVVSIEQFLKIFRKALDSLGAKRRVYILIDDLDRCLPESTLGIFEAIKLFLDAPQCAYVVAVDRAVIRNGLELRYPSRSLAEARALPPVVDPDEYIEKIMTLSVDLPVLSDEDGAELLTSAARGLNLSRGEVGPLVWVLGTNPRRLKRFGTILQFWHDVAQEMQAEGRPLAFSPLKASDRPLFLKLSVLGYLNSAILHAMRRDPGLPGRLQEVCNRVFAGQNLKDGAAAEISKAMEHEAPLVARAALDPAFWRALRLDPLFTNTDRVPVAVRWFRSAT